MFDTKASESEVNTQGHRQTHPLRPSSPLIMMFLLGIMLAGFGQGLTYLGSQELVSRIVTTHQRGEVFSVFNLVVYLGASVAALGVGFGTGLLGFYQATVTVVSVICILALMAGIVSAWIPLLTRQP